MPLSAAVKTPENFLALLASSDAGIGNLIPSWACLSENQLIASAAFYIATDRSAAALLACTGESLRGTVRDAAEIGLSFNRALGHLHMIPYGKTCSLSVDWKGLVEVVYRTCDVQKVDVQVVFEGDDFEPTVGGKEVVRFTPRFSVPRDFEHARVVYAEVVLSSGQPVYEFMDKTEYAPIRALSNSPAAKKWPTEHWRKACLRRLLKRIPKRPDRQGVINKVLHIEHQEFGPLGEDTPVESMADRHARLQAERKAKDQPEDVEGEVVGEADAGVSGQEAAAAQPDPKPPAPSDSREPTAAQGRVLDACIVLADKAKEHGKKDTAGTIAAWATKKATGKATILESLSDAECAKVMATLKEAEAERK